MATLIARMVSLSGRARWAPWLVALAVSFGNCAAAADVADAVHFRGAVWVVDDRGALASFDDTMMERTVRASSGVLKIARWGGEFWILRSAGPRILTVAKWNGVEFVDGASLRLAPHEDLVGFTVHKGIACALTSERVMRLGDKAAQVGRRPGKPTREATLKMMFGRASYLSADTVTDDGLFYTAWNAGEWGGGMYATSFVSGVRSSGLDGNVTAIVKDPRVGDCVLATVGLSHLGDQSGKIVRVCASGATTLHELSVGEYAAPGGSTVAFFSLTADKDGIWGLSQDALYRFEGDRMVSKQALPPFEEREGLTFSRPRPGLLVIATVRYAANSTGGFAPILVPLD